MIDGMANKNFIGVCFFYSTFEGSDKNQFIRVLETILSPKELCMGYAEFKKSDSSAKLPVCSEFMADRKAKAEAKATKAAKAAFIPAWLVGLLSFVTLPTITIPIFLIAAKVHYSNEAYESVMSEYNKSNKSKSNSEPQQEHEKNIDDK